MDLALSPADEAFRDEVRRFLDAHLTDDLREAGRKTGSAGKRGTKKTKEAVKPASSAS